MKTSITSLFSLSSTSFLICETTGIPLSISFPNHGIDFTYSSPFSLYSNILKVTSLPSVDLHKMPKVILSGITLGILSHLSLVERNHLTAAEANIYFQLLPSSLLVSAIKFFSSLETKKYIEVFPHFSLSSIKENVEFSTTANLLENYIKVCREIINPPREESTSTVTIINSDIKPVKVAKQKSLTPEIRNEAKTLVSVLASDVLMTPKLLNILKLVVQKENLITLDNTLRNKIIERISLFETNEATRFISILSSFAREGGIELDRVSDDFAITKTKKSLAEILASKKKGN